MTRASAVFLWGEDVVGQALAESDSEAMTEALARAVQERALDADKPGGAGELARWALTLPWPRFCAVVRLVAGETRRELLAGAEEQDP